LIVMIVGKLSMREQDEHLAFFDWKLSNRVEARKVRLVILSTYEKAPQLRYFRVFN